LITGKFLEACIERIDQILQNKFLSLQGIHLMVRIQSKSPKRHSAQTLASVIRLSQQNAIEFKEYYSCFFLEKENFLYSYKLYRV
jgi:hypothetical protein